MSTVLMFLMQHVLLEHPVVMSGDFLVGVVVIPQIILRVKYMNMIYSITRAGAFRAAACNDGTSCIGIHDRR